MESSVVSGLRLAFGALYSIIIYVLSWVFALVYLLATPFLYLLHGLLRIALFPLQILSKFEAFLYFVTGAVITGVTVGLFIHFSGSALFELLRLQSGQTPLALEQPKPKDEPLSWESQWDSQFLSSTIPEEEEEDNSAT